LAGVRELDVPDRVDAPDFVFEDLLDRDRVGEDTRDAMQEGYQAERSAASSALNKPTVTDHVHCRDIPMFWAETWEYLDSERTW